MKIGLVYGHVASNFGDLCINSGTINLVRETFPDSHLHVVFRNPNRSYYKNALESFKNNMKTSFINFETPSSENKFQKLKEYLLSPESFLYDTKLDDCDLILNNSGEFLFSYKCDYREDLLWRVLPALAAKSKGIKFVSLPATLGPFEDAGGESLIKNFLLLNDAFAVREVNSSKLASEILNGKEVPILLDPAFFLETSKQKEIQTSIPRLGIIMRLEDFGLRVGGERSSKNYRFFKKNGFKDNLAFNCSKQMIKDFITNENGYVDIFVQTKYDHDLANTLVSSLKKDGYGKNITLVTPVSIEDFISSLSKMNFVISSRFHGCILSLILGIPVLGIYFDCHGHKIPGLYQQFKIPHYCFKLTKKSLNDISSSFLIKYHDRMKAFKHIEKEIKQNKKSTIEWMKNLNKDFKLEPRLDENKKAFTTYLSNLVQNSKQ